MYFFPDTGSGDGEKQTYFIGRVKVCKSVIVPGRIVPNHGVLHCGYDNRETVKENYEVLCKNSPCTLRYVEQLPIQCLFRLDVQWIFKLPSLFFCV